MLFGISLPVFGALNFVYATNAASLVSDWYPWPLFWAYLTASGNAAEGTALELFDCAFELLEGIDVTDDAAPAVEPPD